MSWNRIGRTLVHFVGLLANCRRANVSSMAKFGEITNIS
jgi:hypothetical protein